RHSCTQRTASVFTSTAPAPSYTLSLHDALPISRVASKTVAPLYALHEGNILQVSSNTAEPVPGLLGESGNIESADITADGVIAAVRREGDESRFILGDIEGEIEEGQKSETISRPTFENAGQAAWTVVNGDEVMRMVRS